VKGDSFYIPEGLNLSQILLANHLERFNTPSVLSKCHYLIDHLYIWRLLRGDSWNDWVPINSEVLRDLFGTRYAAIVKSLLIRLGVIEVRKRDGRETYQQGNRSKEYRFCLAYRGVPFHLVSASCSRLISRLKRWREESSTFVAQQNAGSKLIYQSCHALKFDVQAANELIGQSEFESSHQRNCWQRCIEAIESGNWRFIRDQQGRLYHSVSNLPRQLRQFITWQGLPLVAADVSSSHPCLLTILYDEPSHERTRYVELLRSGRFYRFLNERLERPYNLDDEAAYVAFKEEVFHRILYSSNHSAPHELWHIFETNFADLAKAVRKAKAIHQRHLSKRLQRLEAQLVVERVANQFAERHAEEKPCLLSIHDSLVSTEQFASELVDILGAEFEATIGFRPNIKAKPFRTGSESEPALIRKFEVKSDLPDDFTTWADFCRREAA
jgi:IS1 family transposase